MDQLDWSESDINIGTSAKLTRTAHVKFEKNTRQPVARWMTQYTERCENWCLLASIDKSVNSSFLQGGFCKTEKTHSATAPFWTIVLLCGLHDGFPVVHPFRASLKAQAKSQALGAPSVHDFYHAKHGPAFRRRANFIQIYASLLALFGFGWCFHQQRVNFCHWARRAPHLKPLSRTTPIDP